MTKTGAFWLALSLTAFALSTTPAQAEGGRWDKAEYKTQNQDGLVWATGVACSSYMSKSFKPEGALGKADVFPYYDVSARVWTPKKTSSEEDWLELTFPETMTKQIRIFETTRPGCISKVVDVATGDVLHAEKVIDAMHRFRGARVLHIELKTARKLSKIKIFVRPKQAGFNCPGIDAVALVAGDAPAEAPSSAPPTEDAPLTVTSGYWSVDEYKGKEIDFDEEDEIVWPTAGAASAQLSAKQGPASCVGPPRIWPKHRVGIPFKGGAWAPKDSRSKKDWLELTFPPTTISQIHVFETYLPGQVWKVEINGKLQIYKKKIKKGAYKRFNQKAQIFWLELSAPTSVTTVKLWFKPKVDFVKPAIDTVGLVPAS